MTFVPFASCNSRSITHLANYLSQSLPMNSSDDSFFSLGWVDPGLICSILTRARSIFLMMSSTVALQMNGLGFLFQACINASIACFRSGTLTKLPRRIAFSVNSLNQRSTKFNQLELVGTKWHTKRGCFLSHACTC